MVGPLPLTGFWSWQHFLVKNALSSASLNALWKKGETPSFGSGIFISHCLKDYVRINCFYLFLFLTHFLQRNPSLGLRLPRLYLNPRNRAELGFLLSQQRGLWRAFMWSELSALELRVEPGGGGEKDNRPYYSRLLNFFRVSWNTAASDHLEILLLLIKGLSTVVWTKDFVIALLIQT